jgi:transcriptional regulator with XRE-family HTH domain
MNPLTGEQLKRWRERKGWTQSELLVALGVGSRQTLNRWERADEIPKLVELAVIALHCAPDHSWEKYLATEVSEADAAATHNLTTAISTS